MDISFVMLMLFGLCLASPVRVRESPAKVKIDSSSTQSLKIHATAAGNQTGKAIATPYYTNGQNWKSTITVGGQELRIWLDTGSSDFWVYSTAMPADQTAGHTLFNPAKSPTFQNVTGSFWGVLYTGNMGADGYYGTDVVSIGGITVDNQTVKLATEVTGVTSGFDGADGILGLVFDNLQNNSGHRVPTFIDNVINSLSEPVFTFDLYNSTAGTFELGYVDESLYTGSLTTVPVEASAGGWFVSGTSFTVNGKNISNRGLYDMAFDTGGEILSFSDDIAAAYWANVPGAVAFHPENAFGTRWNYPCSESQPPVTIHFASTDDTVVIRSEVLDDLRADLGNGTCTGAVWGLFAPSVGAPFFLDYFAVFEPLTPTISFAPKARTGD